MRHLTDHEIAALAGADADPHMRVCQRCRTRLAAWRAIRSASRELASEAVALPGFDTLVKPVLTTAAPVAEAIGPSLVMSWRLASAVVARQFRLFPPALLPLTALGFLAAALIASAAPHGRMATAVFGAAVTLIIQFGTAITCSGRHDPRTELLSAMPIGPATVFAARLALVLTANGVLALITSVAVEEFGGVSSLAGLVASWVGPAMLGSALCVLFGVWRSTLTGSVVGIIVWLLGTMSTFGTHDSVNAVIVRIWATTPWTLAAAAALLVLAVGIMRRPGISPGT